MKTVLITGASRGIGKSIALKFAERHRSPLTDIKTGNKKICNSETYNNEAYNNEAYNIVITCRNNTVLLNEVKLQIENMGCSCITYTGDLSVSGNVLELFNLINNCFGSVDILINNAGISYVGLLQDMTDDEWNTIMSTNVNSVFYCCRAVLPYMITKKCGHIINISSVWGIHGASCEAAYSATKGAVNSLTKALAKEAAPSGIAVNAVACGLIDTEMNNHLSIEEKNSLMEEIPAGRIGTPSEVADAVYNLSLQSVYLTGQIITIDGGWL